MTPVLAVLLLIAVPAQAQATEPPAGPPAAGEQHLPEATSDQVTEPVVPRQQLKILEQDSRLEAYQEFRSLYDASRFE
jgi:hypothetical protein